MANTQPSSLNGSKIQDGKNQRPSELDIALPAMDALSEELNRLAMINTELVGRLRGAAPPAPPAPPAAVRADGGDVGGYLQENAELRTRLEELEHALLASSNDETWADQQREYEALLEEKSEVIRSLHLKIQELQEGARRAKTGPVPKEEELIQLKEELEQQRRQLQEDEEALMTQMRQMEFAMSRERAELARQRQEVQRLQADVNREVEQAAKDDGLRERLASLRRHSDAAKKDGVPDAAASSKTSSGLFKRLFG
jgi:DNA repair exonuclease SbcCD ATPase subunit